MINLMKKINAILIIITSILLISCQSKLDKWETEFQKMLTDNESSLKNHTEQFLKIKKEIDMKVKDYPFLLTVDSNATKTFKKIEINISNNKWNTLFLHYSDLSTFSGNKDTNKLYNPMIDAFSHASSIAKINEGKSNDIFWVKEIKSENFDFDNYSYPMNCYEDFENFISLLSKAKYFLVSIPLRVVNPDMVDIENYYMGEYVGLVFLFDANNTKLIDSYTFYATNNKTVYTKDAWVTNEDLDADLNKNLQTNFNQRLNERFTVKSLDLSGIEFYKYIKPVKN